MASILNRPSGPDTGRTTAAAKIPFFCPSPQNIALPSSFRSGLASVPCSNSPRLKNRPSALSPGTSSPELLRLPDPGRHQVVSIILLGLLLTGLVTASQLGYVESSNGLIPPTLESGKTELEFADINNDGNLDLLSIGDHGSPYVNTDQHGVMVWFGDGQGNWRVHMEGEFGYGGIAVGDVNNDGLLDVGYGMHHNYSGVPFGDQLIEVALGDGTGQNWTPWDSGLARNGETWGMFGTDFADFNNDGWLDLVSNSFGGSAGVHVYLNQHTGYWSQSFGFIGGLSRNEVKAGDIDNDGNVDFVVGHEYGSAYFNDGTGSFVLRDRNLPVPAQQGRPGIALGDIDNDGAQEFSFVGTTGGINVWKWNPLGDSWINRSANLPGAGYQATQLCDMNADGNVDIVGFGDGIGRVWLGDGQGNWTEDATFTTPAPGTCRVLRCGDFDHNGFPDIALVAVAGSRNYARCFREVSVPDSLRIVPAFPRGSERFVAGSVQFVDWWSAAPNPTATRVRLELSTTGPAGPWQVIADSLRNAGRYQWRLPETLTSDNCYLRYVVYDAVNSAFSITPRPFAIIGPTGIRETFAPLTSDRSRTGRLRLYPNPASGWLTLRTEPDAPLPVALFTVTGRKVLDLQLGLNDIRQLAPGVYFAGTHSSRIALTVIVPDFAP